MKDRYLVEYPGPGAPRKFSHFLELYKKPTLREWVKNDPSALDQFVKWVGTDKIGKGASVRHLDAIISNPAAIKAFDRGGTEGTVKLGSVQPHVEIVRHLAPEIVDCLVP
jgi:hypothetical protein